MLASAPSVTEQTTTSNNNSFTAACVFMCERVHNVRTSCVACTHTNIQIQRAMVLTKVTNILYFTYILVT